MNPLLARAIATQRKIEEGESLDQSDAEIINFALQGLVRKGRIPWQRFRDHYIIGTERWKLLDGFDYYRTILIHRKSDVWYPDSNVSQMSIFAVYTSSQVQPPDENVYDSDGGKPSEYVHELLGRAHIGPSIGSSYQKLIEEAPPDLRINGIKTVQENLRNYAKELSEIDSQLAVDRRDKLEHFLREQAKKETSKISEGELVALMEAYLHTQYYKGKPRAIRGPKQKVYDAVRSSCKYVRKQMLKSENSITRDIAKHLDDFVDIGYRCEYRGDWKWHF